MLSLQTDPEWNNFFRLYNSGYWPQDTKIHTATPGFSGATVYRIQSAHGPLALRFWPAEGMSPARWNVISDLLSQLTRHGFPEVAVPIRRRDGQICSTLQGRTVHLEPWLPGQPLNSSLSPPTENQIRSAAQALARLHLASANYMPAPFDQGSLGQPRLEPAPSVTVRLKKLQEILAPGSAERLAAEVFQAGDARLLTLLVRLRSVLERWSAPLLQELQQSVQILLPLQPVWRDLWCDHLLFEGEQFTGLIDPAACSCDCVLTDLARFAGSLLGNQADRWQLLLAEYHCLRPLTSVERQALCLFDLSNVLLSAWRCCELTARAAWAENRSTTPCPAPVDHASLRLQNRLETYLQRLETYAQFRQEMEP